MSRSRLPLAVAMQEGYSDLGASNYRLLLWTSAGSVVGSVLGSYLMQKKLNNEQVKKAVGIVLYVIAANMVWNLSGK